jgi:hypothetical protein
MLALSLIMIGILLRFTPHAANFTPVAAIALFGAAYLNRKQSVLVPLALMMISDLFLGLHNTILFTWGSFALIVVLGFAFNKKPTALRIGAMSLVSSLLFYLITNFGVWLMGWYPHTLKGLVDCYVLALPFLRDFTVATVLYSAVFFGAYELIAQRIKNTKLAKALL